MQVILVKSVRKLGRVGETVVVANGYGRNYLVPQGLAIRATADNLAKFDSLKKELESKNTQQKKEAEKIVKTIGGKNFNFIVQSAADGRLFGSVNAKALAKGISDLAGTNLNYSNIILDNPIKFNGVYDIQVVLHPEVVTNVLVVVAKSESEAQDSLRDHKEAKNKTEEDTKDDELTAIEIESENQFDDIIAEENEK